MYLPKAETRVGTNLESKFLLHSMDDDTMRTKTWRDSSVTLPKAPTIAGFPESHPEPGGDRLSPGRVASWAPPADSQVTHLLIPWSAGTTSRPPTGIICELSETLPLLIFMMVKYA